MIKFDHSVLKGFSPAYAFEFLARRKTHGWRMLGGVLLAFTGVEALFADLGAFSRRAIQLSWLCYAFPCLLLAYTGQAAYIAVSIWAFHFVSICLLYAIPWSIMSRVLDIFVRCLSFGLYSVMYGSFQPVVGQLRHSHSFLLTPSSTIRELM